MPSYFREIGQHAPSWRKWVSCKTLVLWTLECREWTDAALLMHFYVASSVIAAAVDPVALAG